MEIYRQKCSWGKSPLWMNGLVVLLFAIPFIWQDEQKPLEPWVAITILTAFLALLFSGLFYCPRYIAITPDTLIIKRIVASKVIPLSEIESAEPYQRTMNFVRTCGSGGFLGYWGWFHNQELKHFFVYATNLNQLVLVRLRSGRKYVISCTDAPSMATEIARQLRN